MSLFVSSIVFYVDGGYTYILNLNEWIVDNTLIVSCNTTEKYGFLMRKKGRFGNKWQDEVMMKVFILFGEWSNVFDIHLFVSIRATCGPYALHIQLDLLCARRSCSCICWQVMIYETRNTQGKKSKEAPFGGW